MNSTILTKRLDPPFERYIVYSDGNVYCEPKKWFIRPYRINTGYLALQLYSSGKAHHYLVHRLVAICFVPNPNNYTVVNHIDGNRLNNNYTNLEWTTQRGNLFAAQKMGLSPDRFPCPYEVYCPITDESYLFASLKSAMAYVNVPYTSYKSNQVFRTYFRQQIESNQFVKIPPTEWYIRLRTDLRLSDYEWNIV